MHRGPCNEPVYSIIRTAVIYGINAEQYAPVMQQNIPTLTAFIFHTKIDIILCYIIYTFPRKKLIHVRIGLHKCNSLSLRNTLLIYLWFVHIPIKSDQFLYTQLEICALVCLANSFFFGVCFKD